MKNIILISFLSIFVFNSAWSYAGSDTILIAGQTKKKRTKAKRPTSSRKKTSSKNNTRKVDERTYKKYESKKELSQALDFARAKNYTEASKRLFDLSVSPKYRAERNQIKYILGLMLYEMGFYQSAGYQFVGVIREGNNKYVNKSLEKLSLAADILNDKTLLNYSIGKINLETFPKTQRDMLRYRVGEFQYANKQFDKAAHNFGKVPPGSNLFSKAKYMEGLAYVELGQLDDALRAFSTLKDARENSGVTDLNRVSALLAIARIYYQNKDWERAIEAYRDIPRDTMAWHESLFELSWAQMRGAKFRSVLSNFHTLHSPYYEDYYIPESLLLRGIVYLYICQYDEMIKTLDLFERIYNPISNQLKTYLSSRPRAQDYYEELKKIADKQEELYKNPELRKKYSIPYVVANKVLDEGDVKSTQEYIVMLIEEENKMKKMPSSWKSSSVGQSSMKLVDRRLRAAKKKSGILIKGHLIAINKDLDQLLEQHDFARYEALNAKKENIKKKLGESKKSTIDDAIDREYYIQNGYEYWPFQGEYWLDELGNYHYLGTKSCE